MDPLGAEVGTHDPYLYTSNPTYSDIHGGAPLYVEGGDPMNLGDGCGDIDGMPASCSEVRDRMENGSVAAEYMWHNENGFQRQWGAIRSMGVGLFIAEYPSFSINNEWRQGDPLYNVNWKTLAFGFAPQETAKDSPSTCERMARDAQRIANGILNDFKNIYNRVSPADSLKMFNAAFGWVTFGSYFSESPLGFVGTQASGRNNVLGDRSYQGQDGFARQFWDEAEMKAGALNPDQVHHFGAYFSAGLAGHKLAPDIHRADDRDAGRIGDVQLADQSIRLGDYLRRNSAELKNIGQLIRDSICGGGAVPK